MLRIAEGAQHAPCENSKASHHSLFTTFGSILYMVLRMSRLSFLKINHRIAKISLFVVVLFFTRFAFADEGALDQLKASQEIHHFRVESLYLNDADHAFGARFVHEPTGFVLDYLQIQSVPQAFLWVNSFPTSDKGEPHTQEHLLLGKGNIGRSVANLEEMSLASSSAFTMQWRTAYDFYTEAGMDTFYTLFEKQTDALLHPDYTDEEIRREVRNWGVVEDPATKALRLDEKGTVYQEMVSTYDKGGTRAFRTIGQMLYGNTHPLAEESGGLPEALRELQPSDIRKFHSDNYHLGNMGVVASIPPEVAVDDFLNRMDAIFGRLESATATQHFKTLQDLPKPQMASSGEIRIVDYPNENEQQPGLVVFAWPASLQLDVQERLLLELFMNSVAGDATTNLYKLFVDSKTRVMDTNATGVFSFLSDDWTQGNPVFMGLQGVSPASMNEQKISQIRDAMVKELKRISELPADSEELKAFNQRVKSRMVETQRGLAKFVNSPPGFGFRDTGPDWLNHLYHLNQETAFKKSVTMKPELMKIDALLAGNKNIWKEQLAKWKLLAVQPYAVAARPSPALIKQMEAEKAARVKQEMETLKAQYGLTDESAILQRFKSDYDATSAELEKLQSQSAGMHFVDKPPLTLDDSLDYKESKLSGYVPMVTSTFATMTSSTIGLALRLDSVPADKLFYLSMFPSLLTEVGVIRDGKPVSYEEMSEALRKEILSLNADYSTNFRTGRAELVLKGAGNNITESKRAMEWMNWALQSPDWRVENLPRIRDLVDQTLDDLRNRTQAPEEYWVQDPANAYWRQDDALLLSTQSFMTEEHNILRLRWLLKDAGDGAAISPFLETLAGAAAKGNRQDLKSMLAAMKGDADAKVPAALQSYADQFAALPADAKSLAAEAAKDLDQTLAEIPDDSLQQDWEYLAKQINKDLQVKPAVALQQLDDVRKSLLKRGNARMFMIGSKESQAALSTGVDTLVNNLEPGVGATAPQSKERIIDARVLSRTKGSTPPLFVGLINPNTQGGVFLNSAPSASYYNPDADAVLDYLSSRLYAGHGAHGIFMKTWGAGLAYSNGIRGSLKIGRIGYYAERTPELPQTLRFVIDELKKSQPDPHLVEYAIAVAFSESRAADTYEERGEAMAADLADGLTPQVVKTFRQVILQLRQDERLSDELFARKERVYSQILPGYSVKAKDVKGGIYFVIGPEKQLSAYETYLKTSESPDATLVRLYPRDFWLVPNH